MWKQSFLLKVVVFWDNIRIYSIGGFPFTITYLTLVSPICLVLASCYAFWQIICRGLVQFLQFLKLVGLLAPLPKDFFSSELYFWCNSYSRLHNKSFYSFWYSGNAFKSFNVLFSAKTPQLLLVRKQTVLSSKTKHEKILSSLLHIIDVLKFAPILQNDFTL